MSCYATHHAQHDASTAVFVRWMLRPYRLIQTVHHTHIMSMLMAPVWNTYRWNPRQLPEHTLVRSGCALQGLDFSLHIIYLETCKATARCFHTPTFIDCKDRCAGRLCAHVCIGQTIHGSRSTSNDSQHSFLAAQLTGTRQTSCRLSRGGATQTPSPSPEPRRERTNIGL